MDIKLKEYVINKINKILDLDLNDELWVYSISLKNEIFTFSLYYRGFFVLVYTNHNYMSQLLLNKKEFHYDKEKIQKKFNDISNTIFNLIN